MRIAREDGLISSTFITVHDVMRHSTSCRRQPAHVLLSSLPTNVADNNVTVYKDDPRNDIPSAHSSIVVLDVHEIPMSCRMYPLPTLLTAQPNLPSDRMLYNVNDLVLNSLFSVSLKTQAYIDMIEVALQICFHHLQPTLSSTSAS